MPLLLPSRVVDTWCEVWGDCCLIFGNVRFVRGITLWELIFLVIFRVLCLPNTWLKHPVRRCAEAGPVPAADWGAAPGPFVPLRAPGAGFLLPCPPGATLERLACRWVKKRPVLPAFVPLEEA